MTKEVLVGVMGAALGLAQVQHFRALDDVNTRLVRIESILMNGGNHGNRR